MLPAPFDAFRADLALEVDRDVPGRIFGVRTRLAADRARFICQAQSLNLLMPGDVSKKELHEVHFAAWKKGVKSLYYCRSTSMQRADKVSQEVPQAEQLEMKLEPSRKEKKSAKKKEKQTANYEECLACQ